MKAAALSLLLPIIVTAVETNNPGCDNGPSALSHINAPQTCIKMTQGDFSERCLYTYVPQCAMGKNVPLVMDLHGAGSCAQWQATYSDWKEKADSECFVVAWPTGITDKAFSDSQCFQFAGGIPYGQSQMSTTNCCCKKGEDKSGYELIDNAKSPDPTFLRNAIIEIVNKTKNSGALTVDTKRIYMAGHSNGCIGSLSMAATSSDIVAAVCCHAGVAVTPFPATYSPVPIMTISGMKDPDFPWDGNGPFKKVTSTTGTMSMPDMFAHIATKNGCSTTPAESTVGTDKKFTYPNCANNATVVSVALVNDGHNPYPRYGEITQQPPAPGVSPTTADTTSMAWAFCSSHSKSAIPQVFSLLEPNIVATAQASAQHTVFVEALTKANLVTALQGTGPFTVFAPTDAAFTAALTKLNITKQQLLDKADLADILKYHVISGSKITAGMLTATQTPTTLEGQPVTITKVAFTTSVGAVVKFATATVTAADVDCSNGVIHVIDAVVLPPAAAIATSAAVHRFGPIAAVVLAILFAHCMMHLTASSM